MKSLAAATVRARATARGWRSGATQRHRADRPLRLASAALLLAGLLTAGAGPLARTVEARNAALPSPSGSDAGLFDGDASPSGSTYVALAPARILDSRSGLGGVVGPIGSHDARTFQVVGRGGVPTDAVAVTGNLTVTGQNSSGYLYLGPTPLDDPTSSTLNFPLGDDRANGVTVALGEGTLSVTFVAPSAGKTTQVIFDVTGYFVADTSGSTYVALAPARILDSRSGLGGVVGPIGSHDARTFQVVGRGGVPTDAVAVTGNLTVTGQNSSGYLYLGPTPLDDPTSSTLNFPLGDDRANGVTVALGEGTLSVTFVAPSAGKTTQVIFDVTGYFVASSPGTPIWTMDLFDARSDRYQDPDRTACTAASTESMLNTIAYDGPTPGFVWQPDTSYATQESILAFERANMTMLTSSAGTDPHGWRNALNFNGWGSLTAGVYVDSAYPSFDAATKAVVSAIATHREPVGILARSGGHGQVVTGYEVAGDDPSTGSMNFSIVGVDLTDPLQTMADRDAWISIDEWGSGGSTIRFAPYTQNDSPYPDAIDGQVGNAEWYGNWVIIDPVK